MTEGAGTEAGATNDTGACSCSGPPRDRVLPIGEQRPDRGDQRQGLIEHQMVMTLWNLHQRRRAVENLIHVLAGLERHDGAELAAQERHPAVNVRQVFAHLVMRGVPEHAWVELPAPATADLTQRGP